MTVATTLSRISYTEDGVSTVFPVPFRFLADADLVVERIVGGVVTLLALTTDYTVSGADNPTGGSITRTAAANGATLRIRRQTPRSQSMVYTVGDDFPAESHERALDRQMLISQEADATSAETDTRALRVPEGEVAGLLPSAVDRAGKFLAFAAGASAMAIASFGTGADAGLRTDLAFSTGAALIGYNNGLAGGKDRSIKQIVDERVSLMDFWLPVDADHTNAANRFIAYANSTSGYIACRVPQGAFVVSAATTPITADHVYFVGQGRGGSVLDLSYNGATFTWSANGGGFEKLLFDHSAAAPGSSQVVMLVSNGGEQIIKNCYVKNVRRMVQMGTASTTGSALTVVGLNGYRYNGAGNLFDLYGGAGIFWENVGVYVAGVPTPAANRTATMASVVGCNFVGLNGYSWDTISFGSGMVLERYDQVADFTLTAVGQLLLNVEVVDNFIADYIRHDGWHLEAQPSTGGIISFHIRGYTNSWEGNSVRAKAESNITYLSITGLQSAFSGYETVLCDGATGIKYFRLVQPQFTSPNRLAASDVTGRSCVRIASGNVVMLIGGLIGIKDTPGGLNWQGPYGVSLAQDLNLIVCTAGIYAVGATSGWDVPDNVLQSGDRFIGGNLNATYAGWRANSGAFAFPASAASWANLSPFVVRVSLPISLGATDVELIDAAGSSQHVGTSFDLSPGEAFKPTYSGAMGTNKWARIAA